MTEFLQVYLSPLASHLARADVTDLYVNRPGELWLETAVGAIERHEAPELTEAMLWRLARQIASLTHQGINREHPLLAARLPDGARVQFVAPPATRDHMVLAIRKHAVAELTLADYASAFEGLRAGDARTAVDVDLQERYASGDGASFLSAAVRAHKTIIVAGGTSTGKTTFLNALLREIEPNERLVLIEDTPELTLSHQNALGLVAVRGALGETQVTTNDLLTASLRLRPDRIILGEVRGPEAFTFLRAINTGHAGSLTTIHADSPSGVVEQLAMLVAQTGSAIQHADLVRYIHGAVDVFVQLARVGGRRQITEIRWEQAWGPS